MMGAARLQRGDYRVGGKSKKLVGAKLVALVIDTGYPASSAKDISAALGVPVRTVYSWIADARRVGLLPKNL